MAAGQQRARGLVGALPVAGHDLRAAHRNLAALAAGHGLALVVDEDDIGAFERPADMAAEAGVVGAVAEQLFRGNRRGCRREASGSVLGVGCS